MIKLADLLTSANTVVRINIQHMHFGMPEMEAFYTKRYLALTWRWYAVLYFGDK